MIFCKWYCKKELYFVCEYTNKLVHFKAADFELFILIFNFLLFLRVEKHSSSISIKIYCSKHFWCKEMAHLRENSRETKSRSLCAGRYCWQLSYAKPTLRECRCKKLIGLTDESKSVETAKKINVNNTIKTKCIYFSTTTIIIAQSVFVPNVY